MTSAIHSPVIRSPTSLTFRHWAGVSPHTWSYDFAATSVFGKQSPGPGHCDPLCEEAPLSRSYGAILSYDWPSHQEMQELLLSKEVPSTTANNSATKNAKQERKKGGGRCKKVAARAYSRAAMAEFISAISASGATDISFTSSNTVHLGFSSAELIFYTLNIANRHKTKSPWCSTAINGIPATIFPNTSKTPETTLYENI
ncbi:hypothetical protein Sango_2361300 [Sesamum angolense]|uniref:Uncharacterized protein n=1 Tax=Sesamum angolense TaxID=2727404 RepID=A0AAE1W6A2_9LAMI|nr:hypothetical protein Sango_2361300 [Sesamum angolense]